MSIQVGPTEKLMSSAIPGPRSSLFSRICVQAKGLVKGVAYFPLFLTAYAVAHEHGHMLAMYVLFQDVNPSMSCNFAISGLECRTLWNGPAQVLSYPELGHQFNRGLVSAAGPFTDLISVACASLAYFKLRSSYLKTATLMTVCSFLYSHDSYLYSKITENARVGDFAQTEFYLGIPHPIQTAVFSVVALSTFALIYSFGYAYLNRNRPVDEPHGHSNWKRIKLVSIYKLSYFQIN